MNQKPASPGAVPHVAQIDALRGLAALLVSLIFHVHYVLGEFRTGPLDGLPVFTWLHDNGWTLVDLFFLISGFVFSHVYLSEAGLREGVTFRKFMLARLARLYPLHLATLLACAAILWFGRPATWDTVRSDLYHFGLNLLFLQESGLNAGYSFNYPSWSISVEMICYVAFIAAALRGPQLFHRAAILLMFIGAMMTMGGDSIAAHIGRGLFGFFAGYFVWQHRERLSRVPAPVLAAVGVAALLVPSVGALSLGTFLCMTLWPALLLLALRTQFLCTRPFRWLGDRSYSIYMLHAPVYAAINVFVFNGQPVDRALWPLVSGGAALAILGLAHVSFLYLERPARNWINARFGAGSTAPGVAMKVSAPV
jgi:peptidoglycan/LPS O-acetylase OafA/YrhL